MRKKIITATLTTALLLGAAAAHAGGSEPLKRYPSDVSAETVQAVERLEELTGFDGQRNLLTRSFDEAAAQALLEALRSETFEVRQTALRLLDLTVRQQDVPAGYLLGVIRPAVEQSERSVRGASDVRGKELSLLARRVLWQIEVSRIPAGPQRAEFLKGYLDNRQDGYYYPFQALEHLAALQTPTAREIMAGKIEESTRRSVSQKLIEQTRVGIRRFDLLDRLEGMEPAAQVRLLAEELTRSMPDQSLPGREFQTWVVRQIAMRDTADSRELLRMISQDESLGAGLRYEAGESFKSLQARRPKE